MASEVLVVRMNTSRILVKESTGVRVFRGGGPQGPAGVDGASLQEVFIQGVPSAAWVITHALAKFPSVTVVDSAGTVVIGQVIYDSDSQITLSFSAAFSGTAYLN